MIPTINLLAYGQKILDNGVSFSTLKRFIETELNEDGKKHFIVFCEDASESSKCDHGIVLYVMEDEITKPYISQRIVCHLYGESYTVLIHTRKYK